MISLKKYIIRLKNEYFFSFGKYKEQYELGCERVEKSIFTEMPGFGFRGYYSQGVGAANYAKELMKQGDVQQAKKYAQKAIIAWAQYFSYKNDYYNAYVHYALALGILGHEDEMMRALQRSAQLINRDLSYLEFVEVIEFIRKIHTSKY